MQGTFVPHILHYTIKNTSFPPEPYNYSVDFSFSVTVQTIVKIDEILKNRFVDKLRQDAKSG